MTGPSSPTWPSSRVLTAWRPHLERLRARAAWVHHLHLHRVEALVAVARPALEPFHRLLLEAVAAGKSAVDLSRLLHLDAQFLRRLLADLVAAGLLTDAPDGRCTPSDAGRQALNGRRPSSVAHERRTFFFAEGDDSHPGTRFVPLDNPPSAPVTGVDWRFDVNILHDCATKPAEWKQLHGFPLDVCGLAVAQPGRDWRQTTVQQAEELTLLTVLTGDADETLLAFAAGPVDWELDTARPVLTLRAGWHDTFPELAEAVSLDGWRAAWRTWGESRHLPIDELDACQLETAGLALIVRPPPALLERLQSVRGDFWLLAGSGRTRAVASVEIAAV